MASTELVNITESNLHLAYQPAFKCVTKVNISGSHSKRLMLVLRTNGCAYDQNKTGCTMCDFAAHAIPASTLRLSASHLLAQLEGVLQTTAFGEGEVEQLDLLTLGSFLHDWEISASSRTALFERVSTIGGLRKVMIESRAPYVTTLELKRLRHILRGDQVLELGLGVETTNQHLRNVILNKGLSDHAIRSVLRNCADSETEFQAYLLVKPPTLTEREAIEDAVSSAHEMSQVIQSYGIKYRLAFEPVFVPNRGLLKTLFDKKLYQPVNLWSVVEILLRTEFEGIRFVGLSDEGLSSGRTAAAGCPACTLALRAAIGEFNGSQSLEPLIRLQCHCTSSGD